MQFDTALNLIWLGLGLLALGSTARVALRKNADRQPVRAWLHIVGVGLIVAALFPYISATDDVLRIEHFSSQQTSHHANKRTQNDNLMRLYEAMDSPMLCRMCELALTFFFVSLVIVPVLRLIARIVPFESGRSPPTLATA